MQSVRRRIAPLAGLAWAGIGVHSIHGQSAGIRTYCNPLDLDYKYNFEQLHQGISYRSDAAVTSRATRSSNGLDTSSRAKRGTCSAVVESRVSRSLAALGMK